MFGMVNTGESSEDQSARGWLSEADLLEAINEMGYNVSPSELSALRDDIEEFIVEDELNNCRDDDGNESLFSSLQLIGPPPQPSNVDRWDAVNGDGVAVSRALNNAEMVLGAGGNRPPVQGHCGVPVDSVDDIDRDAISDLIFEGYRCIERLCADNARLSQLTKQVVHSHRANARVDVQSEAHLQHLQSPSQDGESDEQRGEPAYSLTDEDGSSERNARDIDPSIRPVLCPVPGGVGSKHDPVKKMELYQRECALYKRDIYAIRPVLCPVPGGVGFRHDPVKKMELYQKEWRRNPPPGEKKRLALRWKVREYMLRQDVPHLSPHHLNRLRTPNPEWVPKRYL